MNTLLISAGGSPAPLVASIRLNQPDCAIFFVSHETRRVVQDEVLPAFPRLTHEFIVTEDPQDAGGCAFLLLEEVPKALRKMGVKGGVWAGRVDYTGGTKPMSAAMLWASTFHPCQLVYVGSKVEGGRDKGGVGAVRSGCEEVMRQPNPWDGMAWYAARDAIQLFNQCQFSAAARAFGSLALRVEAPHRRAVLERLATFALALNAWDIFDHKTAEKLLGSLRREVVAVVPLARHNEPEIEALDRLVPPLLARLAEIKKPMELIRDLLANARRRAVREGKFEDATARCYSAIEKFGKITLKTCGINADKASPESLPESIRDEYTRRYTDSSNRIRFGLMAVYEALHACGHDIGLRFKNREELIRSHLNERNESILAHGFQPLSEQHFRNLFEDALWLMQMEESDLFDFPAL